MPLEAYTWTELFWIVLSIFMLGMSKGGFPIGAVSLPVLILVWPTQQQAARSAVAFMLPMLCVMDIVALVFYRKEVHWNRVLPLLPATVLGVLIASVLFVSDESALLAVSDRSLKLFIGLLGIVFVIYQMARRWLMKRLHRAGHPTVRQASAYGFISGITSTLAHAAGPVIQMYLLPQGLKKMQFAATSVAFFFILNLVKMVPFAFAGRIWADNLLLGLYIIPIIPLGVALGYLSVRKVPEQFYRAFIYVVLAVTSIMLIVKATI